jgi:hypothetical protein
MAKNSPTTTESSGASLASELLGNSAPAPAPLPPGPIIPNPSLAPSVAPTAAPAGPAEEMVTTQVYNREKDTYETVTIKASDMVEEADRADREMLSTGDYDQNFNYYWGHLDPTNQVRLRSRGYAPVRDCPTHRHQVRKLEGLGNVVTLGDLVLFACPKRITEPRRRADRENRKLAKRGHAPTQKIRDMADGRNIQVFGKGLTQELADVAITADGSFAELQARSYADAQARLNAENKTLTFGGFAGSPEFNHTGIPEVAPNSPLGRLMAQEAAGAI